MLIQPGRVLDYPGEDDAMFPILDRNRYEVLVWNERIKQKVWVKEKAIPSNAIARKMTVGEMRERFGDEVAEEINERFRL